MKNSLISAMLFAASAIVFSACQADTADVPENSAKTHNVTFHASQLDTRTSMNIVDGVAKFAWQNEDISKFHIFENGTEAASYNNNLADGLMTISADFSGEAPFTYTGFYAGNVNTDPFVSANQPILSSFDCTNDILIAKPVTNKTSSDLEAGLKFQFKRVVAVNKMTIKGLAEDDVLSEVTISSDKAIAGAYDFSEGTWAAEGKVITLTNQSESVKANRAGEAVVYFICAPVDNAQLTVTVTTTNGNTFTKTFARTISFEEGGVKAFSVSVATAMLNIADYIKANAVVCSEIENKVLTTDGTTVTSIDIDPNITVSVSGPDPTGRFFDDCYWRFYSTRNTTTGTVTAGTVTITAKNSKKIKKLEVRYTANNGQLYYGSKHVPGWGYINIEPSSSSVVLSQNLYSSTELGWINIDRIQIIYE